MLKSLKIPTALLLTAFALAGCRTPEKEDQTALSDLYYRGELAQAAKMADAISVQEAGETTRHALLWHLEAGNTDLAAGKTDDALKALERAEALLYRFDGEGKLQLNKPGNLTYTGERSDRLLLHLLKGFLYLEKGQMEDFLVEIRRMRISQFRYLLCESDPEVREYEKKNRSAGILPCRLQLVLQDGLAQRALQDAGLNPAMLEYSARRRPELSLLFNPLGFYLSAAGYYFNNEWDEALIDMKYLAQIDPGNSLFRRDQATLQKMLGDAQDSRAKPWAHDLGDQVVYIFYAQGHPSGWKNDRKTLHLPGQVPAEWTFSYPDYRRFQGKTLTASSGGEKGRAAELADLGEIVREEFYQRDLAQMLQQLVTDTRAMTAAHTAALASLAAAQASGGEYKAVAVAAASAAVVATSRAYVNQAEWRRWSTIPRHYSVLHLPLGAPGKRTITVQILERDGSVLETRSFTPGDDTNRAVIFIRELDGSRYFKFWESRE